MDMDDAGVSLKHILGQLLFLIYINDLSGMVTSNVNPFVGDTWLFLVFHS